MLLHRLHLDPRNKAARRDLADPYQMHATLCRAFSTPDKKCPEGEFLWRLDPEMNPSEDPRCPGNPRLLIQSRSEPNWSRIEVDGWFFGGRPAPGVPVMERLRIGELTGGQRFRFRLRANPCVNRDGKRLGLLRRNEQEVWLTRKGNLHGFSLQPFRISQERMLRGRKHGGTEIRIYSVLFDGILTMTDAATFRKALETGIGHGKALGLGLLSIVPVS